MVITACRKPSIQPLCTLHTFSQSVWHNFTSANQPSSSTMEGTLWWTNIAMERSTHFSWENPLFLWPFSIAMLVHQRVKHVIFPFKSHKNSGFKPIHTALRPWPQEEIQSALPWGSKWRLEKSPRRCDWKFFYSKKMQKSKFRFGCCQLLYFLGGAFSKWVKAVCTRLIPLYPEVRAEFKVIPWCWHSNAEQIILVPLNRFKAEIDFHHVLNTRMTWLSCIYIYIYISYICIYHTYNTYHIHI